MNELRDMAGQDTETTNIVGTEGFSKDGKTVIVPREQHIMQRWGIWADAEGYSNGRNVGEGSIGIDYRIAPHWILGAYASMWYSHHSYWQAGLYTAFYAGHWWSVIGGGLGENDYTAYASTGYDFHLGDHWIIGPVGSIQYDSDPVDRGFGRGNLFQSRVGGRIAYVNGKWLFELQPMYQNAAINEAHNEQNAVWIGVGVNYIVNDRWSVFGSYSFDGNGDYQINEYDIGARLSF